MYVIPTLHMGQYPTSLHRILCRTLESWILHSLEQSIGWWVGCRPRWQVDDERGDDVDERVRLDAEFGRRVEIE